MARISWAPKTTRARGLIAGLLLSGLLAGYGIAQAQSAPTWLRSYPANLENGCTVMVSEWTDGVYRSVPLQCPAGQNVAWTDSGLVPVAATSQAPTAPQVPAQPPIANVPGLPSAPTAVPPGPEIVQGSGKMGQIVKSGVWALVVNDYRDNLPPSRFNQPKAGSRYFAVDVTVGNDGEATESINPLDFRIKDARGYYYDRTYATGIEPTLKLADLAPGERVRGWLGYEIPNDAGALTLEFKPSFLGVERILVVLAR